MNVKTKNEVKYLGFCAMLGAGIGLIIWAFLKLMSLGIEVIWEMVPEMVNIPFYTIIICTVGGLGIGLFRKKFGDLPEEMDTILLKVKEEKRYEYKNMLPMLVAALLPLLLGASIGPEAGLTGVIVGLCYWAGDNLNYAKQSSEDFSKMGAAVTLGLMFHSPLFGIFEVSESEEPDNTIVLSKNVKIISYGVCIAAGMAVYTFMTDIAGGGMGIPSLSLEGDLLRIDYLMLVVYVVAGCALAWFYEFSHKMTHTLMHKIPDVARETVAGACLGVIGFLLPVVMFSGEESMAEMSELFGVYAVAMWLVIALVKVLITNICIQGGLRGGHFFPLIFAGVSCGYGLAALVVSGTDHQVFAAAIVTAALLGGTMKKPLAVTVLLLICFPAQLILWYFVAATIGSKVFTHSTDEEVKESISQEELEHK